MASAKSYDGLVIAAGGMGARLGLDAPKALLELDGVPMVVHALKLFEPFGLLHRTVVVAPAGHSGVVEDTVTAHFKGWPGLVVVEGGSHRQESVWNGLKALPENTELVVIHDAARPFTPRDVVAECIDVAGKHGAAVAAVPTVDTIVDVETDGTVTRTLDRDRLRAVQTPQVFRYKPVVDAHARAEQDGFVGTDDAGLVMRNGGSVRVVMGSYDNIKITVPRDIEVAARIMRSRCCV